jgi:hypothetical protein
METLKKIIKIWLIIFMYAVGTCIFGLAMAKPSVLGLSRIALAEDEDEEDEDEEVKNDEPQEEYIQKVINTVVPVTTVTTTERVDSDSDGIYDDEDPHPTINEYFIVKDDNLNGIDDRYEQ